MFIESLCLLALSARAEVAWDGRNSPAKLDVRVQSSANLTVARSLGPALKGSTESPQPFQLGLPILSPAPGRDNDRDGLSDAAEAELAQAFRPFMIFDSHENARLSHEPVTLFQVRPLGCVGQLSRCGAPLQVTVVYANLWQWDRGYGPASWWCRLDWHKGDLQGVSMILESDDGASFRVHSIRNWGFTWPAHKTVRFLAGRHFWLYFSSGKHHQFFDTALDAKPSPYTKWKCRDNVDGKGDFMLARVERPQGPGWNNVGEPEAHDPKFFVGDLGSYGYAGEDAWSQKPFCGGMPCEPSNPTSSPASLWSTAAFHDPATGGGRATPASARVLSW